MVRFTSFGMRSLWPHSGQAMTSVVATLLDFFHCSVNQLIHSVVLSVKFFVTIPMGASCRLLLLAIAPLIHFLAKAITPIMAIIIKIDNFIYSPS